jgi:hypothetical protein
MVEAIVGCFLSFSTAAPGFLFKSCSHTLTTAIPMRLSCRVIRLSRIRVASIFARHKALSLDFQTGYRHPCQKSLSTNNAIVPFANMKSGLPGSRDAFRRNLRPTIRRVSATRPSSCVLLLRTRAIRSDRSRGVRKSRMPATSRGFISRNSRHRGKTRRRPR